MHTHTQMYALLAITCALSPASQKQLDENVATQVCVLSGGSEGGEGTHQRGPCRGSAEGRCLGGGGSSLMARH